MHQSGAMGSLSTSLLVPSCPPRPKELFLRNGAWTIWFQGEMEENLVGMPLSSYDVGGRVSSEAKGTCDGVWASCPTCTLGSRRQSVRW